MRVLTLLSESKRLWWVGGGVIALTVSLLLLRAWWVSPEHRIAQFAGALTHGNSAALLSLCDEAEVKRLGLTPDTLGAVLNDALHSSGGVRLTQWEAEIFNESQMRFNRAMHATLTDDKGNTLNDADGKAAVVYIIAYNTRQGWKIALSKFLHTVALARLPGANRYAPLCQRHQMPLEILDPGSGEWKPYHGG